MRPCDNFLTTRGLLLESHGYTPDPGRVRVTDRGITVYHYTREDRIESVLEPEGGLWARLPVVSPLPDHAGLYLVEALLDPLPLWMTDSPYFDDLGLRMLREYVGDVLLELTVPTDFPGLYVADYAHVLECKHIARRGRPALGLGYDCSSGHESAQADANSYIPALRYDGGHVAPEMKITRCGAGIAVPSEHIRVCSVQPPR